MFNWIVSPSDAFARAAEVDCDVGLFICTLALTFGVIAEYLADHFQFEWWHAKKHLWMLIVVFSLVGEAITETGSFVYSFALQASETKTIEALAGVAHTAKSDADTAKTNAGTALTSAGTAQQEAKDAKSALDPIARREGDLQVEEAALSKREADLQAEIAGSEEHLAADEKEQRGFEDAISPRMLDQGKLSSDIWYEDVPFFVMTEQLPFGDPQFASELMVGISLQAHDPRHVTPMRDDGMSLPSGIIIEHFGVNDRSHAAAVALCNSLAEQHLDVSTRTIFSDFEGKNWLKKLPDNGVLVRIARKDTYFFTNKMIAAHGGPPISNSEEMEKEFRKHISPSFASQLPKYLFCS